jgi:malonyl-CoA/methylmalonyl-CoA synthetase
MSLAVVERATAHGDRPAVVDGAGTHGYADLLAASQRVARALLGERDDLREARVAFLAAPGLEYVAVLWGIWRAGGVAVPLCLSHPLPELEYVIGDAGAEIIVASRAYEDVARASARARGARPLRVVDALSTAGEARGALPSIGADRRALILYTSGTTSRPKGAVLTHANLGAQITALVEAWEWAADDRILHVLPLHHTHGIVNALLCALWTGACCEMEPGFDAQRVWQRFAAGGISLFMAVPTIYVKLIAAWQASPAATRERWAAAARRLRLMVSGSAALPVTTFETWREITGRTLLERYGMTEIGMALSNPLHGERRAGTVGQPLPGVELCLLDESGERITGDDVAGEIHVRGPAVFREYWQRPDATRAAFRDGWFRTGDVAAVENGYYRILGRSSIDIIKTGGYKVSALEIEEALRTHAEVADCAVVGIADEEWGERICAAVVAVNGASPSPDALQAWLAERLAPYKLPRRWRIAEALPRNAMGKVTKPDVKRFFA